MGRLDQDNQSPYPNNQPQFQPDYYSHAQVAQEHQYEPDTVDVPPPTYYTDEYQSDTYQNDHSSNPPENDPQTQPPPPSQQQQQQQPTRPVQFPRPNPQSTGPQPVVYPPPSPQKMGQQPQNYPPQAYPPRAQPQAYHPQAQQQQQGFAPQAVQFPPASPVYAGGYVGNQGMPPASPHKPVGPVSLGTPIQNTYPTPQVGTQGWKTDLFGCMEDPNNALITACFPCVTFGQIAEILDQGQTPCGTSGMLYGLIACFIGIPCIISCGYRAKLRNRFGLIESPGPDWITHCFCEWCALCQEYRELQARGIDPSIGWMGNVAKMQQQQQVAMMPPMNQTMRG